MAAEHEYTLQLKISKQLVEQDIAELEQLLTETIQVYLMRRNLRREQETLLRREQKPLTPTPKTARYCPTEFDQELARVMKVKL